MSERFPTTKSSEICKIIEAIRLLLGSEFNSIELAFSERLFSYLNLVSHKLYYYIGTIISADIKENYSLLYISIVSYIHFLFPLFEKYNVWTIFYKILHGVVKGHDEGLTFYIINVEFKLNYSILQRWESIKKFMIYA